MNIAIASLFFSFFAVFAHANQGDQNACIAEFSKQCQSKCEQANVVNCAQKCHDDAVNQCREAGE